MNNENIENDCILYGTQLTYEKLEKQVRPLYDKVQKWQKTELKKMSNEWTTAYFALMEQINTDDETIWKMMHIFNIQNNAEVPKEGVREYQLANGFVKLFMQRPDMDSDLFEITPMSKKRAIEEYKSTIISELNILATTQRSPLQRNVFDANPHNIHRIIHDFMLPLLNDQWLYKWWFVQDIQATILTPLDEMLNTYKDFNCSGNDICIIGDKIMRIVTWCDLNFIRGNIDENVDWR